MSENIRLAWLKRRQEGVIRRAEPGPAAIARLRVFLLSGEVQRGSEYPRAEDLPICCSRWHVARAKREFFGDQRKALEELLSKHTAVQTVVAIEDRAQARKLLRRFMREE